MSGTLAKLVAELRRRQAEFEAAAGDVGVVGMPATVTIDEMLALLDGQPQPGRHTFIVTVDAETARQATQVLAGLLDGNRTITWELEHGSVA